MAWSGVFWGPSPWWVSLRWEACASLLQLPSPVFSCVFLSLPGPGSLFTSPLFILVFSLSLPFVFKLSCPFLSLNANISLHGPPSLSLWSLAWHSVLCALVYASPCASELPCCHPSRWDFTPAPPAPGPSLLSAWAIPFLGKPRGLLWDNKQPFVWVAFDGSYLGAHRIDRPQKERAGQGCSEEVVIANSFVETLRHQPYL